jgi:hypothetical protein
MESGARSGGGGGGGGGGVGGGVSLPPGEKHGEEVRFVTEAMNTASATVETTSADYYSDSYAHFVRVFSHPSAFLAPLLPPLTWNPAHSPFPF